MHSRLVRAKGNKNEYTTTANKAAKLFDANQAGESIWGKKPRCDSYIH
jgi:hypothetical protein